MCKRMADIIWTEIEQFPCGGERLKLVTTSSFKELDKESKHRDEMEMDDEEEDEVFVRFGFPPSLLLLSLPPPLFAPMLVNPLSCSIPAFLSPLACGRTIRRVCSEKKRYRLQTLRPQRKSTKEDPDINMGMDPGALVLRYLSGPLASIVLSRTVVASVHPDVFHPKEEDWLNRRQPRRFITGYKIR